VRIGGEDSPAIVRRRADEIEWDLREAEKARAENLRRQNMSPLEAKVELAFAEGEQTRSCEVIWRHGKICGVKFAS
jgi:hypothetical protein